MSEGCPRPSAAERTLDSLARVAAQRATPWTILALALGLRLHGLGRGYWIEEFSTLSVIGDGRLSELVERLRGYDHPPVYFLLLRAWSSLGTSETALRLLSVLFGLALVWIVLRWAGRRHALSGALAGLLVATLPSFLRTSSELRGYALLLVASAATFLAAERLAERPERNGGYLALGGALALAAGTHHIGSLLAPAALTLVLVATPRRRSLLPFRLTMALATPFVVAVLTRGFHFTGVKRQHGWWMPELDGALALRTMRSFVAPVAPDWQQILAPSTGELILELGIVILSALAVRAGWRSGRSLPLLMAALAFWLTLVAVSLLILPVFWNRTALPGLLPLVVAVAVGVPSAPRPSVRLALVVGTVALALVFGYRWLRFDGGRAL